MGSGEAGSGCSGKGWEKVLRPLRGVCGWGVKRARREIEGACSQWFLQYIRYRRRTLTKAPFLEVTVTIRVWIR